jgi:solute carrier family 25 uncoupling protein 27
MKIICVEGFLGIWKGVVLMPSISCQHGELGYDNAKHFIIGKIFNDNLYAHTLASVASGMSATALSYQADVIKTGR